MALIKCPSCGKDVSGSANSCPNCGHPMMPSNCPKCGSGNIETISNFSKSMSVQFWGPFASKTASSTYKCRKCGHKF